MGILPSFAARGAKVAIFKEWGWGGDWKTKTVFWIQNSENLTTFYLFTDSNPQKINLY